MVKKTLEVRQVHIPKCPFCAGICTAFAGEALPEEGDISICSVCIKPAIITTTQDNELTLRKPFGIEEWKVCGLALDTLTGKQDGTS